LKLNVALTVALLACSHFAAAAYPDGRVTLRFDGCDRASYQVLVCTFEGAQKRGIEACINSLADRVEEMASDGSLAPFCSARLAVVSNKVTHSPDEVADWIRQ
jgi:hypothetical protein